MRDEGSNIDGYRQELAGLADQGQEDIPTLALTALDRHDLDVVARDLGLSDISRLELLEYEEVVGDLGLAAPLASPPPNLRDRILDATQQHQKAPISANILFDVDQPLLWSELSVTNLDESPGYLARAADGRPTFLVLTGLEAEPEYVYQAWLIDETPLPAGTFRPIPDGTGNLILELSTEPEHGFTEIGVTIEPHGGSAQPTTEPIIVAKIG